MNERSSLTRLVFIFAILFNARGQPSNRDNSCGGINSNRNGTLESSLENQGVCNLSTTVCICEESLNCRQHALTGSIPTTLGLCVDLNDINFAGNDLTHTIPTEIGNLENIGTLYVDDSPSLIVLDSTDARCDGRLPYLQHLKEQQSDTHDSTGIWKIDTSFNSVWPYVFSRVYLDGRMFSLILDVRTYSDVSMNELAGTIPSELQNLSVLEVLQVSNNQITGSIPSELGRLSNLRKLILYVL